jgi:hypothetical protein
LLVIITIICYLNFTEPVFTMWQHLILLAIKQYEGKSYSMFTEWLVEVYYLRLFLGLKFTDRINNSLLEKIISSFIVISGTRHIFVGIDSTGFKITHSSQYYTERTGLRRKYAKLSIGADVLQQIICNIRIRRASTRHDNIDFKPNHNEGIKYTSIICSYSG